MNDEAITRKDKLYAELFGDMDRLITDITEKLPQRIDGLIVKVNEASLNAEQNFADSAHTLGELFIGNVKEHSGSIVKTSIEAEGRINQATLRASVKLEALIGNLVKASNENMQKYASILQQIERGLHDAHVNAKSSIDFQAGEVKVGLVGYAAEVTDNLKGVVEGVLKKELRNMIHKSVEEILGAEVEKQMKAVNDGVSNFNASKIAADASIAKLKDIAANLVTKLLVNMSIISAAAVVVAHYWN